MSRVSLAFYFFTVLAAAFPAFGQDYVRLRNGQVIECAILRQDTSTVFTTEWASRQTSFPPLQVFSRDEIESIWFIKPEAAVRQRIAYQPVPSQFEYGGSFAFQSWSGSGLTRRGLVLFSGMGGMSILKQVGLELDADVTIPFGGASDTTWKDLDVGYQVSMNVVAQPMIYRGFVPFLLAGGGAAREVPYGDVVITPNNQDWSMLNLGAGVKWGANGLGYRAEFRYSLYSFTPDKEVDLVRVPTQDRSALALRFSVFLY